MRDIEHMVERNIEIANEAYDMAKHMSRMVMADTASKGGDDVSLDLAMQVGAILTNKKLHTSCAVLGRVIGGIAMTAWRIAGIKPMVTVSCITVLASVVVDQLQHDEHEGPKH